MVVQFEWDPKKATSNQRKHHITFEEAQTVFADLHAIIVPDTWYSDAEEREIIIGYSSRNRLVFVVFTERSQLVIRIISARRATLKERHDYETSTEHNE